jgi:hypothetical protein
MRRRVINALTLVSAVVCVGSALLVGRSFFRVDVVRVPASPGSVGATAFDAKLILWESPIPGDRRYFTEDVTEYRSAVAKVWNDITGIHWLAVGWGSSIGGNYLILPLWLVPIVTAILPVRWWMRRRREGRRGFEVGVGSTL